MDNFISVDAISLKIQEAIITYYYMDDNNRCKQKCKQQRSLM